MLVEVQAMELVMLCLLDSSALYNDLSSRKQVSVSFAPISLTRDEPVFAGIPYST